MAEFYTFARDNDRAVLRIASELGMKAGTAAVTACETAECTQGKHEAQMLSGYSEENLIRLDKMVYGSLELPTLARLALKTGLRVYVRKLEKLAESEGSLLVDNSVTGEMLAEVARCLRILNREDPELPLDDDERAELFSGAEDRPSSVNEAFREFAETMDKMPGETTVKFGDAPPITFGKGKGKGRAWKGTRTPEPV